MRAAPCLILLFFLSSCWKWKIDLGNTNPGIINNTRVWGNKPIYETIIKAKNISYSNLPRKVVNAGNIYIKDNYIFQVETGTGIHVIDNSNPAAAHRIGFITINGCSQISIKGNSLYSNSYDDLVVVDLTDPTNLKEVSRVKGAFPEGAREYFYIQPPEQGAYECPRYDSLVVGWRKDSINAGCWR